MVLLQFLDSYKSVTLQSMAQSFGVSVDFIDSELADFIVAGRLTAKIDKVAGVVETNRQAYSGLMHTARLLPLCFTGQSCTRIIAVLPDAVCLVQLYSSGLLFTVSCFADLMPRMLSTNRRSSMGTFC